MRKLGMEKKIETTAIVIYILSIAAIMVFHEPWFDEAQAWLIVRDNSIFDVLWKVLRYEGHPPLWYLCLYIPVRMGIPFELGIKLVNLFFSTLGAAILIKKSPFPLLIRITLPFTYFFFYQYGVISRSYSLLAVVLWLIAVFFPKRNAKSIRFTFLLGLLGGVTAHGMLFAFGLALAWFIEIAKEKFQTNKRVRFKKVLLDKRAISLFVLALLNLMYAAILWPMPDKLTPLQNGSLNINESVLKFILLPLNGIVFELSYNFGFWTLLLIALSGILLTAGYFLWSLSSGVSYYIIIPYFLVTAFISTIYFAAHHSGIFALMLVFGFWISKDGEKIFLPNRIAKKLVNCFIYQLSKVIAPASFFKVLLSIILIVQLYWSGCAAFNEILLPYAASSDLAAFIQHHNIYESKIYNSYLVCDKKISYSSQNIETLAYFKRNIFYNHNFGNKNKSYSTHKQYSEASVKGYLVKSGKPDFIIKHEYPLKMYPDLPSSVEYAPVARFKACYMWKDTIKNKQYTIYARKQILPLYPDLQR